LRRDLEKWVEVFIKKFGDFNVSRFNEENIFSENIIQDITTSAFLNQPKLVVIENFPISSDIKMKDEDKDGLARIEDLIIKNIENVPDSNFLLFIQPHPDNRRSFSKKLSNIATVKEYKDIK
jgi:hypothetical protein